MPYMRVAYDRPPEPSCFMQRIDPMLCRCAYIFAENENGPDVKLGSKRQGRCRLLDWEKPEEAKARPNPTSNSLRLTVNRSSICWARPATAPNKAAGPLI